MKKIIIIVLKIAKVPCVILRSLFCPDERKIIYLLLLFTFLLWGNYEALLPVNIGAGLPLLASRFVLLFIIIQYGMFTLFSFIGVYLWSLVLYISYYDGEAQIIVKDESMASAFLFGWIFCAVNDGRTPFHSFILTVNARLINALIVLFCLPLIVLELISRLLGIKKQFLFPRFFGF